MEVFCSDWYLLLLLINIYLMYVLNEYIQEEKDAFDFVFYFIFIIIYIYFCTYKHSLKWIERKETRRGVRNRVVNRTEQKINEQFFIETFLLLSQKTSYLFAIINNVIYIIYKYHFLFNMKNMSFLLTITIDALVIFLSSKRVFHFSLTYQIFLSLYINYFDLFLQISTNV
jgi:hypothetical protein